MPLAVANSLHGRAAALISDSVLLKRALRLVDQKTLSDFDGGEISIVEKKKKCQ